MRPLYRPQLRVRTFMILVAIFALFLAFQTTSGPWRQFQRTADQYAKSAAESARRAELETLEGVKWAKLAADLPIGDLEQVAATKRAAQHQSLAEYFSELAVSDSSMERAYRRLSWRPWESAPPDPLPPEPLRSRVPKATPAAKPPR